MEKMIKIKIKKMENLKSELVISMFVDALTLSLTTGVMLKPLNSEVNGAKETLLTVLNV